MLLDIRIPNGYDKGSWDLLKTRIIQGQSIDIQQTDRGELSMYPLSGPIIAYDTGIDRRLVVPHEASLSNCGLRALFQERCRIVYDKD